MCLQIKPYCFVGLDWFCLVKADKVISCEHIIIVDVVVVEEITDAGVVDCELSWQVYCIGAAIVLHRIL